MNAAQRSSRTVSMAGFELTARDAVIGQSGTLTVVKPGNGYTFRFSYAFGGASGTLESGDVRQVSHAAGRAVYRWRVPEELAQQIPDALRGTGTMSMAVYSGAETVVGGGLAADVAYEAEVSAVDTAGGVRTVRQLLPPVSPVTLHLHSGGRGAAFGKRSTGEALECAWPAVFYGDVEVSGGLTLGGQALADALWPVGCVRLTAEDAEPQPSPEGAEWERVECGMAGIYAWRRIT